MTLEENIVEDLKSRFNLPQEKIRIARARRIFIDLELSQLNGLMDYVVKQMGFSSLSAITGIDEGADLGCIYHLGASCGIMMNIKAMFPRDNPVIQTVMGIFSGAEIYERELADLFGIKVEGLPPGNRYPLADDWPKDEFPLRKDWKKK